MTSPINALRDAIRLRLQADAGVLALLREPKIFADPPKHAAFPHIAFVAATARENGTSSEDGYATDLTLGIWCRGNGSGEGLQIADTVTVALASLPNALTGHRLINLLVLAIEPGLLKDGETWRIQLRMRAVTEVM
jgi:Protein of unknown function (DUF3168)